MFQIFCLSVFPPDDQTVQQKQVYLDPCNNFFVEETSFIVFANIYVSTFHFFTLQDRWEPLNMG
jgi:hypothetical protein